MPATSPRSIAGPDAVADNTRRARLVLACATVPAALALALVVAVPAGVALGPVGALVGLGVGVLVVAGAAVALHTGSARVVLAVTGARPAEGPEHARLHNLVEGLCVAGGLPKPGVWVIDHEATNALAVARSPEDAAVVVTSGLLGALTRVELEGVLAQELGRIRNGDAQAGALAATCLGGLAVLSRSGSPSRTADPAPPVPVGPVPSTAPARWGLPLLVVAPLTAWLVARLVAEHTASRADLAAVQITRYPPALARALEKLAVAPGPPMAAPVLAHLWLVPADGPRRPAVDRLYDRPPSLEQRIATLQEL